MIDIFDLLNAIRSKLTKAHARIMVEIFDIGIGDGLRFQFYDMKTNLSKLASLYQKLE